MENTSEAKNKKHFFGSKMPFLTKKCNFTAKLITTQLTSDNSHSDRQVKLHSYTNTIWFHGYQDCACLRFLKLAKNDFEGSRTFDSIFNSLLHFLFFQQCLIVPLA